MAEYKFTYFVSSEEFERLSLISTEKNDTWLIVPNNTEINPQKFIKDTDIEAPYQIENQNFQEPEPEPMKLLATGSTDIDDNSKEFKMFNEKGEETTFTEILQQIGFKNQNQDPKETE
jgi:hypothetical protein